MTIEFNQEADIQIPREDQQNVKIPYDTAPMEAVIGPDESVCLHGGITINNKTNAIIKINEEFLLQRGGYHLMIVDQISGASLFAQSPMNSAYELISVEDQLILKKV